MVEDQWGNELFCIAARCNCFPMVRRLLTLARSNGYLRHQLTYEQRWSNGSSYGRPSHQSIGEAVYENHVEMVEYLLAQEELKTHLEYRNLDGENVFHLASRFCNPAIFRMLIAKFKEGATQTDENNNTALVRIITAPTLLPAQRYESARKMVFESGSDTNVLHRDERHRALIHTARRYGHLDIARLLADMDGADLPQIV